MRLTIGGPRGDGDDAAALREQPVELGPRLRRHDRAPGKHLFGRALDDDAALAVFLHEHRREAALVVERQRGEALDVLRRQPRRIGGLPESAVERVATDDPAVRADGVGALETSAQDRIRRPARRVERRGEGDPAFGQRAGLVREEHVDVAEVLDGDQPLDEDLPLRQPSRAGGEAHGLDRRQELRRHPHCDGQREQERVQRVAADRDVDPEDPDGHHGRHAHEEGRVLPQADLERRLGRPLAQLHRDGPESGCRAGFGDDPPAASVLDDRADERAGGQRHRGLQRLDRLDLLLRRRSLAGQHRLVALEAVCPQQPQIGWHHIADAELDHVSRDQRGHVDSGGLAVAHYERGVPELGVQLFYGAFGAVLVDEPQPDGKTDDRQDDDAFVVSPTKPDTKAVPMSKISNGFLN